MLSPANFFAVAGEVGGIYVEPRLYARFRAGSNVVSQPHTVLASSTGTTSGDVLLCKGLGKTTSLQYAFWATAADYLGHRLGVRLPYWVRPDDRARLTSRLRDFPPMLLCIDFDELVAHHQYEMALWLRTNLFDARSAGHRILAAYRGWRRPSRDPVMRILLECMPLVYEVEPLRPVEAAGVWQRRGLELGLVENLARALDDRLLEMAQNASPNNLPTQPTPLIGRQQDLLTLDKLWRTNRLVTLTGPGGAGKTSLAIEVGRQALYTFEDGLFFIDLASVHSAAQVIPVIANTLAGFKVLGASFHDQSHDQDGPLATSAAPFQVQSNLDALKLTLREKELALIIDNMEHVLGAASDLGDLVSACPMLKVLVTSRERLHVRGEQEFPVPTLTTALVTDETTGDVVAEGPAVQLFLHYARLCRPDFNLNKRDTVAVREICHQLDGLPLAIELVAGRVKSMPVEEIFRRLTDPNRGDSLDLLTVGNESVAHRHRTLRDTIDWSYLLLNSEEQAVFRALTIFKGGFTLETADAVLRGIEVAEPAAFTRPLPSIIEALIDKSLIRRNEAVISPADMADRLAPPSKTASRGQPRLSMLETIREYGREKLRAGTEAESYARRHATYFQTLAAEAAEKLEGSDAAFWLRKLESEYANVRDALEWTFTHEPLPTTIQFVTTLYWFWHSRGYWPEGLTWLKRARGLVGDDPTPELAELLHDSGYLSADQGDYASALRYMEACVAIRRQLGDEWGVARALNNLGTVARDQRDYATAFNYYQEALTIARVLGEERGVGALLSNMGVAAYDQGDYEQAQRLLEESLTVRRRLKNDQAIAISLNNLGLVYYRLGRYMAARVLFQESLKLDREIQDSNATAEPLLNLGNIARAEGNLSLALAHLRESLTLYSEAGNMRGTAEALEALAGVLADQGAREAGVVFGAAQMIRREIGSPLPPVEQQDQVRNMAIAQERLGAAELEALVIQGANVDLTEVIGMALGRRPLD
ncbi:MAG: tetratricopeptide repeat protein [Anaerolineae bacterium]